MKKYLYLILIFLFPILVLGQSFSLAPTTTSGFKDFIAYIRDIIYLLVPILMSLAFILFFWGLSKFVIGAGNEAELKKGKEYMLWGILALFILITYRTIVGLISNEFDFGNSTTIPLLPTGGQVESVDSNITFPN